MQLPERTGELLLEKNVRPMSSVITAGRRLRTNIEHIHKGRINPTDLVDTCRQTDTRYNVTCVLLNARSICNKAVTVKEHLLDGGGDFVFLTETWCKPNKTAVVNEITPPGYSYIGEYRSAKRGGGVEYYTSLNIKPNLLFLTVSAYISIPFDTVSSLPYCFSLSQHTFI